jgi:hypothetical protein
VVDYNPDKYKNHSESIARIKELNTRINNTQFFVGIDYLNKISGRISDKRFSEISHSILSRISSIIFHYEILDSIYSSNRKIITSQWDPIIDHQFAIKQKFVFDSIIFNAISLFDYFSCLVTFTRESNKDNWRKMWISLASYSRNNNEFKQSSLGTKIIEIDRIWLSKLNAYRAELIHYDTKDLGVSSSWNLINGEVNILVKAPIELKKVFKNLSKIEKHEDFNINSISLWIIETCLLLLCDLQVSLKEYIEKKRVIPEEKAIYFSKI